MDVIIAFSLGVVTVVMGYLGIHLTMNLPESPSTRTRYRLAFVLLAIVAVGLNVWQTLRNVNSQQQLQTKLNEIERNTKQPPIVQVSPQINIPPQPHPSSPARPYLQITKVETGRPRVYGIEGQQLNIWVKNVGSLPARDFVGFSNIVQEAYNLAGEKAAFKTIQEKIARWKRQKQGQYQRDVGIAEEFYFTAVGGSLTDEQWKMVLSGDRPLYIVVALQYSDQQQEQHLTEFCLYTSANDPRIWVFCNSHNVVR